MKQIVTAIFIIVFMVSVLAIVFTLSQVDKEESRYKNDLQNRTTLLAESFKETIEPNFVSKSDAYLQTVVQRFANRERFAGLAVYDHTGTLIAASSSVPATASAVRKIAADSMDANEANGDFVQLSKNKLYVLSTPLHDSNSVVGALIVAQNADFIDSRIEEIWRNSLLRLFLQILLVALAVFFVIRWLIYEPVHNLTHALRMTRTGSSHDTREVVTSSLFQPLTAEVTSMRQTLMDARLAATEEARASLEKLDAPWTEERLKEFIHDTITDRQIFTLSNREPYIHTKSGNKITSYTPASGMVTAIEPVMKAAGGTWIAYGSGDADRLVVDKNDRIAVPPDNPKYTLRRIWLSSEQEQRYYDGFSNEGIWPLSHTAYTRPIFRKEDWEAYKDVNALFAQTLLEEIKNVHRPVVLIQDFHLALVPRIVKQARPDAAVGLFWHVPWVSAEAFSICPWKKDILAGMLGADLIGFHTQLHCNNFIETVGRELESLIDFEQFSLTRNNHTTFVKPFPIGIAFTNNREYTPPDNEELEKRKALLKTANVATKYIVLGVDRLDYTKGILERLKAIEIILGKYPEYIEQLTFVQLAAPTRTKVKRYRDYQLEVENEVERINNRFKTRTWKPIVFIERYHDQETITRWYQIANVCLVTSLHDGMNLVAKEFIGAREDNRGVLILSSFAGASKELRDALLVNPYNGEQTAEAIHTAVTMSAAEQTKRMKKLRDNVRRHNVYRWSAEYLKILTNIS